MRAFVLRLLDEHLRDGRVVGRVQDVTTGAEIVVRDIEELLAFLVEAADAIDVIDVVEAPVRPAP